MRPARLGALLAMAWTAAGSVAPAVAGHVQPSPFEACSASAERPQTQVHVLCLYRVAVREQRLPELRERLVVLGAGSDAHPWPTLVLGYATQEADEPRALALYEAAARGFVRLADAEGEVLARHNLRNLHYRRGAADAAANHVARALASAEASGQPLVIARASVLEANHLVQTGGDMGRAYRTLQRARTLAFPDGPIGLRRAILLTLANASFYFDRFDETIAALQQHRDLRQEDGSTVDAATVAFNLLNARLTQAERRPRPGARDELIREASEVLKEVQHLQRPALVAQTHRVLADLTRTIDPSLATSHLAQCLALEQSLGQPELRAGCLWTRALLEARRDPRGADAASLAAIDALATTPGSPLLVYAWQARLRLVWQTLPERQAMRASLEALDAIERLRARQGDDTSRAALFSHWTRDYYWLAGRLLQADTPQWPEAFEVGERLRTRVLLEHLARAGLAATVDRTGSIATTDRVPFASLDQVQRELDDTEALLWYSVAPWEDVYGDFGGGAWLVTVTRRRIGVHRLPASLDLQGRVTAFVGLLRDRAQPAERWTPAAARLGQMLLGPAITSLPRDVTRLVIVSDGDLHALPFEALVPIPGRPPLGDRFDVTVVPSATLWQHLRRRRTATPRRAALVLADPDLPRVASRDEPPLSPLPWARREARAIARTLRLDASQVRQGLDASERALKQAPIGEVAVLHLAAHARADEAFPERSAVFLAPGPTPEDGRLEPREIAALQLHGRLVVLSACESASGSIMSGEGPLSLARAFFAGGAGAVVATRWPMRDDDAAFIMARFYEALVAGEGAAGALRRARHDAAAHGLPAAAWAGLVLLGEGRRPVLADMPPPPIVPAAALLVTALMAIAASGAVAIVRRRRTRTAG
jgi:CHAT domain-containing protein